MKRIKLLSLLVTSIIVTSCATGYKPEGFGGGFSEFKMADNIWQVDFRGNGYTSKQRARDFAMLRAAELTTMAGYPYFVIADSADTSTIQMYSNPVVANTNYGMGNATTTFSGGGISTINKPAVGNVVIGIANKPANTFAFEGKTIIQSIKAKYKLQ